jgi:hypothetical protein
MIRLRLLIFLSCLFSSVCGFAQQAALDGPQVLYRRFRTQGLLLHSRGFGAQLTFGKHVTGKIDRLWHFELATINHPKEFSTRNSSFPNTASYVFGKMASVAVFRAGYGFQQTLYAKEVLGAVEIRATYMGGLSLGLSKPTFLEVRVRDSFNGEIAVESQRYNPATMSQDDIVGSSPFLRGISSTFLNPGAFLKSGLSFDFAHDDDRRKQLEVGLIADYFFVPLEMMAFNKKEPFVFCLYLNYAWGPKKLQ